MRAQARLAFDRLGVLAPLRAARRRLWLATDPALLERDRQYRRRLGAFVRQYGAALAPAAAPVAHARTALVVGSCCPTLESELAVIKALELGGFRTVVAVRDAFRGLRPYYALAGVAAVHAWSEFATSASGVERRAGSLIADCGRLEEFIALEADGVRVGRIAASTALREERVGSLDPSLPAHRAVLTRRLSLSLAATAEAQALLDHVRPSLAVFVDSEYTPAGELFDACLERGIDVVAYDAAHRASALMFKRYSKANRNDHLASLSQKSWAQVSRRRWREADERRLGTELSNSYETGDWYAACWTQQRTRRVGTSELRQSLQLDPSKPTAVIFAHILWDAPLMWATPLFTTYEGWLLETVRAACENPRVEWLVKIHPANVGKQAKEGYAQPAAELTAVARLGPLPKHVRVLPPESDIRTSSLLEEVDYGLTVRGTVGIEAARLGIPVLTAAAARYSGRGFTIDSASQDEYLNRLSNLEEQAPLSASQRELAQRYGHGLFVRRPLAMRAVTWDFGHLRDTTAATIHIKSSREWASAPDVRTLAAWLSESQDEDLLAEEAADD